MPQPSPHIPASRATSRYGGVYLELEVIGSSRDIPDSLRWLVDPIVRRVFARVTLDRLSNKPNTQCVYGICRKLQNRAGLFYLKAAIHNQFRAADKSPKSVMRPICDRSAYGWW